MSRIRSKNTGPEITVRSVLHSMGLRFRLHVKELPGKPDIVLKRHWTAIFVNGCFWHRHEGCRFAYTPKSRTEFWLGKFADNVRRDIEKHKRLEEQGWRVLIIWECETSDRDALENRLRAFFSACS